MQDYSPPQTSLEIRHEGTLDADGMGTFHIVLTVSLYYPFKLPDFRITPMDGLEKVLSREHVAAIEAETNVTQALEAPDDPLPAQFKYMCKMLHALVAAQETPQAALNDLPWMPGISKLRPRENVGRVLCAESLMPQSHVDPEVS